MTSAGVLARPYLSAPSRLALIFGAFFVLCAPLSAMQLADVSPFVWNVASQAYALVFGTTHFAVTFSLYANSRTLAFFGSSWRNRLVYFAAPAVIFIGLFLLGALRVNTGTGSLGFLVYLFAFNLVTRGADFLHVVRQSFGVLQLIKRQTGAGFPEWMRSADNGFFLCMATLQLVSFLRGFTLGDMRLARFDAGDPRALALAALAGLLLLSSLAGFAIAARRSASPRAVLVPLGYFLLQAASATLPVWWSNLYLASLAMHYVEYHVVIYPRLFQAELGGARIDRVAAWLRSHKAVFYVALLFVAAWVWASQRAAAAMPTEQTVWFAANVFNGIFLAHYFVEAFVWKFSEPHYRQTLGPLYFPLRARSSP